MPALSSSNPQASAQLRNRAIFKVQHSSSERNVHDQVDLRLKFMKCREMRSGLKLGQKQKEVSEG